MTDSNGQTDNLKTSTNSGPLGVKPDAPLSDVPSLQKAPVVEQNSPVSPTVIQPQTPVATNSDPAHDDAVAAATTGVSSNQPTGQMPAVSSEVTENVPVASSPQQVPSEAPAVVQTMPAVEDVTVFKQQYAVSPIDQKAPASNSQVVSPQYQQTNQIPPANVAPPSPTESFMSTNQPRGSKMKFVFLFVIILIIAGAIGGAIYYFTKSEGNTTVSTQDVSPTVLPTEVYPVPTEYTTSELIRSFVELLAEDNFALSGTTNLNKGGCNAVITTTAKVSKNDYYKKIDASYANQSDPNCTGTFSYPVYLEVYEIGAVYNSRSNEASNFTTVSASTLPELFAPKERLSQLIPYPTLLKVESASLIKDNNKEIVANYKSDTLSGVFTFTVNSEGKIIRIEHSLSGSTADLGYIDSGEDTITYGIQNIILPLSPNTSS